MKSNWKVIVALQKSNLTNYSMLARANISTGMADLLLGQWSWDWRRGGDLEGRNKYRGVSKLLRNIWRPASQGQRGWCAPQGWAKGPYCIQWQNAQVQQQVCLDGGKIEKQRWWNRGSFSDFAPHRTYWFDSKRHSYPWHETIIVRCPFLGISKSGSVCEQLVPQQGQQWRWNHWWKLGERRRHSSKWHR